MAVLANLPGQQDVPAGPNPPPNLVRWGTGPVFDENAAIRANNAYGYHPESVPALGPAITYNSAGLPNTPPKPAAPPPPAGPSPADLAAWYDAASNRDAANQEALTQGQMTNAMNQYASQFQASQASQQQAMNAALMSSLQGLGARRDSAAKVAAGMPGQINATYNQVNADTSRENKLQGVGGQTGIDPGIAALINENHGAERGAALSTTPLMQAGITADYSKGDTTLHNTHMANEAQLAAEAQANNLELAKMKMGILSQQADYQHQVDARKSSLGDEEKFYMFKLQHPDGTNPTEQDKINAMIQEGQAKQGIDAGFTGSNPYGAMQKVLGESYTNALSSALAGTGTEGGALTGGPQKGSALLPGQYDAKGKPITISGDGQTLLSQAYAARPDVVRALAQMGNPWAKTFLGSKTPSSGSVAGG